MGGHFDSRRRGATATYRARVYRRRNARCNEGQGKAGALVSNGEFELYMHSNRPQATRRLSRLRAVELSAARTTVDALPSPKVGMLP
jgi:hypothetical protein